MFGSMGKKRKGPPPASDESSDSSKKKGSLREWLKSILLAVVLFFFIKTFILQTFVIISGSMEDTLLVGDMLVANRLAIGARIPGTERHIPGYSEPRRGDVMIFDPHHEAELKLVKRIVGLPGADDTVIDVYGRIRLYSDSSFTVADGTGTALDLIGMTGSQPLDVTSPIDSIDVTTYEFAQESILKIDNALRQINDVRAGLGALTNRLQGTVSNMMIAAENLTASMSRIRDADFAAETAALTRAQILQQSGVAALVQANQTPQAAMQLLQ